MYKANVLSQIFPVKVKKLISEIVHIKHQQMKKKCHKSRKRNVTKLEAILKYEIQNGLSKLE
jgi:hypothetical protein